MGSAKGFNAAAEKTSITIEGVSRHDVELLYRLIKYVIRHNDNEDPLLDEVNDKLLNLDVNDKITAAPLSKFIHLALKARLGEEYYLRQVRQSEWQINTAYEAFKGFPDQSNE